MGRLDMIARIKNGTDKDGKHMGFWDAYKYCRRMNEKRICSLRMALQSRFTSIVYIESVGKS